MASTKRLGDCSVGDRMRPGDGTGPLYEIVSISGETMRIRRISRDEFDGNEQDVPYDPNTSVVVVPLKREREKR